MAVRIHTWITVFCCQLNCHTVILYVNLGFYVSYEGFVAKEPELLHPFDPIEIKTDYI